MSLEDRYVTPTPEGVSLDVALAGLGSRFGAILLDSLIQGAVGIVFVLIVANVVSTSGQSAPILLGGFEFLAVVLIEFGYFVFFETFWSGRTIGKRAMGIKVVSTSGAPAGFLAILLRNMARLVDLLPTAYLVGTISILASSNNQRLGDMLGGTLVIRERHAADRLQSRAVGTPQQFWATPVLGSATSATYNQQLPDHLENWDTSHVTDADVALIRQFLARRWEYTAESRERLAAQLRERISSRVVGSDDNLTDEKFLESVSQIKAVRR
jgi:uncharacterized RDD family membrane protein YckC